MIDTIRFQIPVNQDLFDQVRSKSEEVLKYNHESKIVISRYWRTNVSVGSYSKDISIFLSLNHPTKLFLEFSVPKYYFGHNLFMVYPTQLWSILDNFYTELQKFFPSFPHYEKWLVKRLDICYSWKFSSQDHASDILDIIRSFDFPRKRVHRYDTSVMYIGSSYSVKWYLKEPEFYAHDFNFLKKHDIESAYKYLTFASGILRFEVTMRPPALKQHFGYKTLFLTDFINTEKIESLLNYFLKKSLPFNNDTFTTTKEAIAIIKENSHTSSQFSRLLTYYLAIQSPDPQISREVKASLSRSQVYRNNRYLKQWGIGINSADTTKKVDLDGLKIPSSLATSYDPTLGDFVCLL